MVRLVMVVQVRATPSHMLFNTSRGIAGGESASIVCSKIVIDGDRMSIPDGLPSFLLGIHKCSVFCS